MATIPPSEWVPHVEAYVDVSRPPAQHSASVDALAALVNKGELTLFDLVSKMEMYLTTTDHIVRSRGILLLGEILCRMSLKWVDTNTIATLSDFFISKLSDWQALRGALVGCLALLHRKQSVGSIVSVDVKRLLESFLQNVQVQSLAAADRKLCFQILSCTLYQYPEAIKTMDGEQLLYGICEAIDEEKDPECLKLAFQVVDVVMKLFSDPSGLAAQFANEVFEILSKYFPVYFIHGEGDELDSTRDDLSRALMHAFCSTPYFEPFVIPLLLDKLSSSLPLAKFESLKYLDNCIRCYEVDRMVRHASAIWFKLKEVIFSLSPDQLLLTSGSPKDAEKVKNQLVSEALKCLKTAIVHISSSDKDLVIKMILLDEDIVNKIHSISSVKKSILNSSEDLIQLHALGNVISIIAESSAYFCTRVLQEHFGHLVDILGASAGCESQQLNTFSGSSCTSINFGALYLSVQILSSYREVYLVSFEVFSSLKSENESWWLILEKELNQLFHLLGSIFTIASQSESMLRQEYVSCAVKGLQILGTFPEHCSPLPSNAYEDVLLMLTSVITHKYENVNLWGLSLKTLTSIGLSITELHASQKAVIYSRTVVDKIVSLVESYDTLMPLNLRLEASYEVGTAGLNYMLRVARSLEKAVLTNISEANERMECAEHVVHLLECYSNRVLPWLLTAGGANELASSFAMRLWDEMDFATLDRISLQGLLESLMTGMKLLVGVCREEQQSLIVQKAYSIISSMLSLPLKSMRYHILDVDELVLSHSVHATALVSMLSSLIIGLRPQTPAPDMMVMINLFTAYLLKGHMPAAYALASIFNKYLHNPEFSQENQLDKILDIVLERCFSAVLASSYSKISHSSDTSDYVNFCGGPSGNILSINILSGLAWIGKGLLMRGDEKVKDISMFLLKCLCSDDTLASIQSHQEEPYVSNSSDITLATSAAGAFHVLMSDSEVCLNKKFHSRIKPLYKQRFFSILMPIFLSKIKESTAITRLALYRAFGHIISNAPVQAVITEAHQILLVMVDSLAKLSVDIYDKDLVYSLLLVLSGMLMDEKGKECILDNIHITITVLTQLVSYPHMMAVRETSLQCLVAISTFPHSKIYRMRLQVLKAAVKALDDKKRAVRQEAVRCRQAWQSFA